MPQDSWYYFLAIESDLERTARFVEPLVANDSCYSVEFARLLMGAAAEAEAVATQFVGQLVTLPKNPNIDDLRAAFQKHYPKFNTMEILVPRASRKLIPWSAWADSKNPEWWTAHNRVKHDRHNWFADAFPRKHTECCRRATLSSALRSSAGIQKRLAGTMVSVPQHSRAL
jgi:hypothetical protein